MNNDPSKSGDAPGPARPDTMQDPDRQSQPVDQEQPPRLAFPVVGIGASAGGLEAFMEFFKAMPAESGMSFVLIQHLPPERESMMAEILSKRTAMPVLEVKDGMGVEPNHVYVIRPGHTLTIREGKLHLGEVLSKPGHSRPVDDFFKSLAEEQRERSIAIVMSGMGSNGSAGAQAIKVVGGVCIAQDPDSAKFPSMPRHLIDAGWADFILRPDQMPEMLLSFARHPYIKGRRDTTSLLDRERQHFAVNEELQSTNEELETSKEELQSMNEELSTVNSQLQTKMEELESTTNDLSSLLTSTDIGVVFLDARLRIRRSTPAMRDLIEMIPSDIGRPLSDLNRKFEDPDLLEDAQQVLDRLVPIEREVRSQSGRWYQRRILPYRTADDRIMGLVITFVDVSERRSAVEALQKLEERLRLSIEASEVSEWEMDLHTREAYWSPRARGLLGIPPTAANDFETGLAMIHPEDRRRLQEAVAGAESPGSAGTYRTEFRVVQPGGQVRWIEARGKVWFSEDPMEHRPAVLRGTLIDISDLKRAEEALAHAKQEAEATNMAKDQFLANVSHELRTPLSAILLWSKMLRDQKLDGEQLKEALQAIDQSAMSQKALIDDLLDTSQIVSGKMRIQPRAIDVVSVARGALEAMRPAAEAKGVALRAGLPSEPVTMMADADRIQQVLWNLLANAIKFTPKGGSVSIQLEQGRQEVVIRVRDTGQGITADFLPSLFERFAQAGGAGVRTSRGMGLGLAISRQLVELHGGTIAAESEGDGRGSVFTVRLPLAATREPAGSEGPVAPSDHQLQGVRVLLVEDDAATRFVFARLLEGAGAEVIDTSSAADALKAFGSARPHVILSDIAMPGMDGYELMRRVREVEAREGLAATPAVAVTAFPGDEPRQKAIAAGFQHYRSKPPETTELVNLIARLARP